MIEASPGPKSGPTPGIRSLRWLVMTKPICPWVSTAALAAPSCPR